jgi:hypothetical protein
MTTNYMDIPIPEITITQEQVDERNREISKREVAEFIANPPTKYFAYINEQTRKMTTWTGDFLGAVSFGKEYRSNFGDKRVSISVMAVNGKHYYGTYYKDSGNYCRIKLQTTNNWSGVYYCPKL